MLTTYATGLIGVVVVAVAWVAVQLAWKRVFPSECPEPDALASRGSCHGCSKDRGDMPLLLSEPKRRFKLLKQTRHVPSDGGSDDGRG